jgi:hypothetical protein
VNIPGRNNFSHCNTRVLFIFEIPTNLEHARNNNTLYSSNEEKIKANTNYMLNEI